MQKEYLFINKGKAFNLNTAIRGSKVKTRRLKTVFKN